MICKIIGGILCLLIVIGAIVITVIFLVEDKNGCKFIVGNKSCCEASFDDADWKGCASSTSLLTKGLVDYKKTNNYCRLKEDDPEPKHSSYLCYTHSDKESTEKHCALLCNNPENYENILKDALAEQWDKLINGSDE